MVIDGQRHFTTREAARRLHYIRNYVTTLCQTGKLQATKRSGRWCIPEEAVRNYEPPSTGHPRAVAPDGWETFMDIAEREHVTRQCVHYWRKVGKLPGARKFNRNGNVFWVAPAGSVER